MGDIMKWKYGLLSFLIFISCIIPTSADTTVFYDENDEGLSYYEFDSAVNNFLQPKYLNNISTLAKSLNGSDIEETTWNIAIWESDNIEYNFTKANLTQPTFTYYYDNGSLINITVENPDNFTLQTPEQTINLKSGICSDYTLLTAGLLLADGYQPVYIFDLNASDNKPGHVFCAIKINNTFYAIDQNPPIQEVDYHIYSFENDYNMTINHVVYYEIAIDNGTTVVNKYNYTYNNNSIQFGGFNELPYLEYKTNIILNQSKVVDGNLYNLTNISTSVEASGYITYTIKAKYDDVFEDEWAKYLINKSEIFDTNWERYYAHVYEDGENIIINITIANVSDDLAVAPIPVPTTEEETVNVKYINSLPYTINQSGYYILNTTCTNLTTTAITIDVDNVVLDGNGKVLDGNNTEYTYGVYVNNGKNITIKNLTIREFMCGISLDSSSNNTIASVNALNNVKGIFLTDSSNNIIANNTFENCGLFVAEDSYNNKVKNNTINGKPLIYLENEKDKVIDNNAGQVIAISCINITVKDLSLNNATVGLEFINVSNSKITNITALYNNIKGIYLEYSSNNTIASVNALNSWCGIYLWGSSNNIITNVNALNNDYGIYLSDSSNNAIYLNNFIDNDYSIGIGVYNTYNNTFHSPTQINYSYNGKTYTNYLGNHYSDYNGTDNNGDGIGDTAYIIIDFGLDNKDSYPLIAPVENYIINGKEENNTNESAPIKTIVAVYMVGSDLESGGNAGTNDINEMINGYQKNPTNDMEIVIAYGGAYKTGWEGITYANITDLDNDLTDGYIDGYDSNDNTCYIYKDTNANMGDAETLKNFLQFVENNCSGDRYILIFWDHGAAYDGYGFDENHNNDGLNLTELREALNSTNITFDLIGFDACLMASLEVANTVDNFGNYMVASEELEPGHGWDYEAIIGNLTTNPNISTVELGKVIVDSFINNPNHDPCKTLSLVNLSKTDEVINSLNNLSVKLCNLTDPNEYYGEIVQSVVEAQDFGKSEKDDTEISIDIKHFATITDEKISNISEADDLINSIDDFVIYSKHDSEKPNSYGVSIFSPENIDNIDGYWDVRVSDEWYDFVNKLYDYDDNESPTIQMVGYNEYKVNDNLAVSDVEMIYIAEENGSMIILGTDTPIYNKTNGTYILPEWNGEWIYLYDNTTDSEVPIPLVFEEVSEDGLYIYSAEIDLTRDNYTEMAVLYMLINPENWEIEEIYAIPYEIDENGNILFSKEYVELDEGNILTFYAPAIDENSTDTWIEIGEIEITNNTEFIHDYLPDGTYYYALYAEDFNGNANISEPIILGADLTITNIEVDEAYYRTPTTISLTIKNIGHYADAGAFNLSLDIDGTTITKIDDGLPIGEETTLTFNWTPNNTGKITITAYADSTNNIDEENEINNIKTKELNIIEQPVFIKIESTESTNNTLINASIIITNPNNKRPITEFNGTLNLTNLEVINYSLSDINTTSNYFNGTVENGTGTFTILKLTLNITNTSKNYTIELKEINLLDEDNYKFNNKIKLNSTITNKIKIDEIKIIPMENMNISIIQLNETPLNITIPLINATIDKVINELNTSAIEEVYNKSDEIIHNNTKDKTSAEQIADEILENIKPAIINGFNITNISKTVKEYILPDKKLIITNITMNITNTSNKGFITLEVPIGDINTSNLTIKADEIELKEFGSSAVNTSVGWYITHNRTLEITLVKDPVLVISYSTSIQTEDSSSVSTSPTSSSSGGGGHIPTDGIVSLNIKNFINNVKLIVGSPIDENLSAKSLKSSYERYNKSQEINENCILVGGPVANPVVKKYEWSFKIKITNEYPGENVGVIQKQLINGHTVILLAGSDRWGTKAAVEYFKLLDTIPDEPMFVQWKNGAPVVINKP